MRNLVCSEIFSVFLLDLYFNYFSGTFSPQMNLEQLSATTKKQSRICANETNCTNKTVPIREIHCIRTNSWLFFELHPKAKFICD